MNEQTKTHLEHSREIEVLNQEIRNLKSIYKTAVECHNIRRKNLRDAEIKICQLTATFKDIIERLEHDQKTATNELLKTYLDTINLVAHSIYYEHNGVYFWQLND